MHHAVMMCSRREDKGRALLISGPKRAVRFLDSTPVKRRYGSTESNLPPGWALANPLCYKLSVCAREEIWETRHWK
jgi:hypothetical protein